MACIDGAFLCSTLMEVRAVCRLDGNPLRTTELRAFKATVEAFWKLTHM